MDNEMEEKEKLFKAIADMNVPLARTLILDNNVVPVGASGFKMFHFMQKVAEMNDKPLLEQLVKHNGAVAGRLLWNVLDNVKLATRLVHAGVDVNIRRSSASMMTFLYALLGSQNPNNYELIALMIDRGADVVATPPYNFDEGYSVLARAIKTDAPGSIIEKILSHATAQFERNFEVVLRSKRAAELMPLVISSITADSPDDDTISKRARCAFHHLIQSNSGIDFIEALFAYNIDVDEYVNADGFSYTALHYAIWMGNLEVVELLLKRNADPNKRMLYGELRWCQPYWIASTLKESSVSALLIKYGADIQRENSNGQHPIHGACLGGSLCNTLLLARLGTDVNVVDNAGQTPLALVSQLLTRDYRLETIGLQNLIRLSHLARLHLQDFIRLSLLAATRSEVRWGDPLCNFVVRQLALAASRGDEINVRDISAIQTCPEHYNPSFNECLNELQRMRKIGAADGIPYYAFLIGNVERTSRFTRREDLSNAFENQTGLRELFPYYFCDLRNAYVFAKEREAQLIAKEQFLDELFTEKLQVPLPYIIINKIANYLCSDFVLDFHLPMFPQMIWE